MQRGDAVAAPGEPLGEFVDLKARAAEDEREGR